MTFKPVTHVLFDMDGLILNTEEMYTNVFQKIASRYGKEFTFDFKCKLMGLQEREVAGDTIRELQLPISIDDFLSETHEILHDMFTRTEIMPGVERLIVHLHANNIPIGLATSSSKDVYDIKIQKHQELFSLFQHKTWGSSDPEVKRGKPHPDIFLVAAAKFVDKPDPEQCLVFEDSLNGVKAAHAAGMQVVMVPDPRFNHEMAPEATQILKTMECFRPEEFGLPPFGNDEGLTCKC